MTHWITIRSYEEPHDADLDRQLLRLRGISAETNVDATRVVLQAPQHHARRAAEILGERVDLDSGALTERPGG